MRPQKWEKNDNVEVKIVAMARAPQGMQAETCMIGRHACVGVGEGSAEQFAIDP